MTTEGAAARLAAVTDDEPERFYSLLRGQRDLFELIARGEPLALVLDALVRLIEAHLSNGALASVLLLDEEGERLLHGAAPSLPRDYNEAIHGVEIGPSVGSCGTAAYRGEPVFVADIETDPLWAGFRDLARAAGLRACWSIPIIAADRSVLGTFAVYHPRPGEPDEGDRAVLSTFVQTAAVAIERHRDVTAILREKRSAEALQRVGQAIMARLDLSEVVQVATDAATDLTGAEFGAFFYNAIDDRGETYTLYTLSGAPYEAFERFPMPRNTAIFGPTFRGEGTVRLTDVTADPRFGQNAPFHGMPPGHLPVRSYLAVPVISGGGEVAGGLFFGHSQPGVFDAEAGRLAEGIAAQAAIGIENARLYGDAQREIEARNRAYEERARVARTLQQSLLPPHLPRIPRIELAARYEACAEDIGGDFYDVFALGPGRWGIVVGDVCGKGADAAALTALARHTVTTAAMLDPEPTEVLQVLNAALYKHDTHRFATAIYALLSETDDGGLRLTVALGGHPAPLLLRDGGIASIGEPGLLVGGFPELVVAETTVDLRPGDAVVFYTDGLTDVWRDGDILGERWVRETLMACHNAPAGVIVDRLADGAVALQQGASGRDDIAVLTLTVSGA